MNSGYKPDWHTPAMAAGTTEVITDSQEIIRAIERFQAGTKKSWCACVESSLPAFSVGSVKKGYVAASRRGVAIRYITELTSDNLPHCREIIRFAELRHLKGVKGNFAVSESEYVAGVLKEGRLVSLVRTDVAEFVRQQQLSFETLWYNAVPAEGRIS